MSKSILSVKKYHIIEYQKIVLNSVLCSDGKTRIVDGNGRIYQSPSLDCAEIYEHPSNEFLDKSKWCHSIYRMLLINVRTRNRTYSGAKTWSKKIVNMVTCARLRGLDRARIRGTQKRYCDSKDTHCWGSAISRMWCEGNSRMKYYRRSGWVKWCQSVVNNSSKRAMARHGK